MFKKLIYVMVFVLALSSTAHAAVYLWNGGAADGLWETPANWTVTDSTWTWPNEENAADPNAMAYVNSDVLAIDIIDGSAVERGDTLRIKGADELTTAVLTLDNASSLTVSGRLSIGTDPDDLLRIGELNVLNGSILTILDGANGNDLNVTDTPNSVGTINIFDSTVDVFDDIMLDEGEATINITNSTVTADDLKVADGATGVATLNVSGSTVTLGDDLVIDEGEGTINITDSTIVVDDIIIANSATGVGTMNVSGATTIDLGDDVKVGDDGVGTLNISGDAVINVPDEVYIGDVAGSTGTLNVYGNGTLNVVDDIDVGDDGLGTLNISENGTVNVEDNLYIAEVAGSEGHMTVSGNGTLNVVDDVDVGDYDFGTLDVSENATLNVDDDISVGQNDGTEGRMTISGNATVNCEDLVVCESGGSTGFLHIFGNPTINLVESLYMNDDHDSTPSTSQVIMDGGTMTAGSYCTIGDDNPGSAEFIMNGGRFYCADYLNLGDDLDGTAHLTMNGGEIITGNRLMIGNSGGDDTGQVRIFMNGGLLQAEELSDIKITDTLIIFTGGVFRIGADDLDVAGMQELVDDGTIVIADDLVHSIVSNGIYTELNALSPSIPQMPIPADGAEGVVLGSSLRWAPGATAATNDVSFGTTNPPAFAASVDAAPYYPGPLEPGTTYYWQVDAVEEDGVTKHSGEVWSFTATDATNNVVLDISIATEDDDAEEEVITGEMDLGSSDLEFTSDNDVTDPNDEQVVGIRFADVGIPAGAAITSASVQFQADDVDDDEHVGDAYTLIQGELSPDPVTFEDTLNNITARPRTTAQVPWGPTHWATVGEKYLTSDISSVIQELIDQDGWAGGNALVLILSQDPANTSTGVLEAEAGPGSDAALLLVEAIVTGASQSNPANGAEGVPLDATLGWWPGIGAVSHDVYLDTVPMTPLPMPPYVVDGDSHSLPWVVANGTITFDGQIYDDGGDPDFKSAGASGNTFDIPDDRSWAKLSFDFDVDSVEFVYGGNAGNITVEAKNSAGAVVDSFSQADTHDGFPAGPVTLSGSGIRSLNWKSTSYFNVFAALDNVIVTAVPPALLGSTTQVSMDTGVLVPSTIYYWQVDTIEADGTKHIGAIWSFTTVPGEATQPDPADNAVGVALDKVLSWKSGATADTRDVYFGTTSPPPLIGSQTDPNYDPNGLEMETTYYWQVDEIDADGITVYAGDIWSFKTSRPGTGTILYEIWDGIGGTSISDLTGNENYPYMPTSSTELSLFETPTDRADDFGGRVHGYLHPDTSGDYTFWIATDDNGELWLSTDESPANAVLVSTVSAYASARNFDDGDVTPSEPISLEGGQKYYILALYKEGGGGDNCAVAWEGPDSPTRAVINGYYLSPYVEFKNTGPDPADGLTGVSKTVTLSWTPGGAATSHDVYLSTDSAAVSDGTAFVTIVTEASYSPAGLEKGLTYYWRVDAVDADSTTHTGDVWSFTVTTLGR